MSTRAYMPPATKVEYETPPELFDKLDVEFGPFNLDPAAADGQYSAEIIWSRGGEYMIAPPLNEQGEPQNVSGPAFCVDTDKNERVYYDGLKTPWRIGRTPVDNPPGIVFLNPPYGRGMMKWITKAVSEVEKRNALRVVALIPARTDTKMWQEYVLQDVETAKSQNVVCHPFLRRVIFLPGRVRFGGAEGPAPFPSAVVVWSWE